MLMPRFALFVHQGLDSESRAGVSGLERANAAAKARCNRRDGFASPEHSPHGANGNI
jgi:hypothetical protein